MTGRAIYPGTFDPVTYGHIDLIKRARKIFREVIVAVAHNPGKDPLFTVDERLKFLRQATRGMRGVTVEDFDGLVVEHARRRGAPVMVRGLRMLSDFEYEFQMALMNRHLEPTLETVFMMPAEQYTYLSSRLIKEVFHLGGQVQGLVPPLVEQRLREKSAAAGSRQ